MQLFAEDHLPLVAAVLRRFPHRYCEREELYQQGCVGLMKALARYEPERGAAFSTYAAAMILGEMRMLSRQNAPIHIPRQEREQRIRIRKAMHTLSAQLGREPTVHELASMLRMDAAELMLQMEEITVSSTDEPLSDGRNLLEHLPDADDWMRRIEIRDMIERLPEVDRRLLTLRYMHGFTQAETARQLGMTQVQVSRREIVLRKELRDAWRE